jgi:hypothetical protein
MVPTRCDRKVCARTRAAEPAEQVLDLVSYWKAKERTYPRLSVMALELLSIPAMSADAERVFSRYVWIPAYIQAYIVKLLIQKAAAAQSYSSQTTAPVSRRSLSKPTNAFGSGKSRVHWQRL